MYIPNILVSSARPAALPPRLPAYTLYGEVGPGGLPDRLHAESIATRSRDHDWEIRPHRHAALSQWLVLVRGQAMARLDGQALQLQGPGVVTVPALAAHGFEFSTDVECHVITLPEPHLRALLAPHPGLAEQLLVLRGGALHADCPAAAAVLAAAEHLRAEAATPARWRAAALDAAMLALAVALARAMPVPAAAQAGAPRERARFHVQRLQAVLETQYRRQPQQAELAAQLGLTPTQLNRACRQVLGHSAMGVLHARLLLQARRELAYTAASVKQVALELGFSDAAYFTRFFRRATGITPSAWRLAARQAHAPAAAGPAAR